MFNSKQYTSNPQSLNITQLLNERMVNSKSGLQVRRKLQCAAPFLQHLEPCGILKGHSDGVNCLDWSADGRVLASGSNEQLCLWDPFRKKRLQCINTEIVGNTSSVKFLPKPNDTLIATTGTQREIMLFDINHPTKPLYTYYCHHPTSKKLATAPDSPFVVWSAGEDGRILQLDHREQHSCLLLDSEVLLINLKSEISEFPTPLSIAVNPARTEYIAVGANDPYARLYDRRMLVLRRSESSRIPKDCVTYYCPGLVSKNIADIPAITQLTFNATGNELLVNMEYDQIYLFDLYNAEQPVFLNLPQYKTNSGANSVKSDDIEMPIQAINRKKVPEHIKECKKLGNEFLENQEYYLAIRAYSEAISQASQWPVLYLNRATAYIKRAWLGDVYAALKDCHTALNLDPAYVEAHFLLVRSLLKLERAYEADECLKEFIRRFPNYVNNHDVLMLNKDIKEDIKKNRQTIPRVSGMFVDEEERIDNEFYWRCKAKDYSQRLVGHFNLIPDIKEANYFGFDGNYIVAGSDDGNFFIWECKSGNIQSIYKADSAIVNCVLPHPEICLMATSGIDHDIKIWSPMLNEERVNFIDPLGRCVEDNQLKMKADPFDISTRNAFCWNG